MLVAVVCTRHESACCRDHAPALIVVCNGAAMKLSLMEQACECCTVQGGGGRKVRARVCLWHSGADCLPPRPRTCTDCVLQRSRNEAPTDGASLRRLLHGARRTGTQGACSSLPPGTRVQIACRPDQAPALVVVCNGAAMKLSLMEQACGCCTVQGGGGRKVRARRCRLHSA